MREQYPPPPPPNIKQMLIKRGDIKCTSKSEIVFPAMEQVPLKVK